MISDTTTPACKFDIYGDDFPEYVVSGTILSGPAVPCFSGTGDQDFLHDVLFFANNFDDATFDKLYVAENSVFHSAPSPIPGGEGYCATTVPGYECNQLKFSFLGYNFLDKDGNPVSSNDNVENVQIYESYNDMTVESEFYDQSRNMNAEEILDLL
jgi:hypothetical protein